MNQKLRLLEALVNANAFIYAESILNLIGPAIDLNNDKQLLSAMFEFINWVIHPVYYPISPARFTTKNPTPVKQFPYDPNIPRADQVQVAQVLTHDLKMYETLTRVLKAIGPAIGSDAITYTKILRLYRAYFQKHAAQNKDHAAILENIQYVCKNILLPGLSLAPQNPGIVSTFWTVFQEFDYMFRYHAYEEWVTLSIYMNPTMILEAHQSVKETRKWLKKFTSDKDKIKQHGRLMGVFSHNNPCLVFKDVLFQVKNFPNMIENIVNTFNYCSSLSLDVIMFLIIRDLSCYKQEKLDPSGNFSSTVVNLASFAGHYLRKTYTVS